MAQNAQHKNLMEFQNRINYQFNDASLILKALTHSSFQSSEARLNYERLEFLGDSVLNFVTSGYLFKNQSEFDEGKLSKARAIIISKDILSQIALEIGLDKYVIVGKGQNAAQLLRSKSVLTDSLEAMFGAIFIDSDINAVSNVIIELLQNKINEIIENKIDRNFKTSLQEYTQKYLQERPIYSVVKLKGPEHNKEYTVKVSLGRKKLALGVGFSKKEAEQEAAERALEILEKKSP